MKIPALLCAAVFLSSCLFAQTEISRSLTLREAETIALRDNPRLKSLADEVRVKQADVVSAAKRLNPVFSFDGDGIRGLNTSEMAFRLDQEFELGGKRRLRTEVVQLEVEIEDLVLQNERFRLLLAVRQAYLRAAFAAKQLSIFREQRLWSFSETSSSSTSGICSSLVVKHM
ncbi:MAG: TolC family protein [Acidobacteriota bacterium]